MQKLYNRPTIFYAYFHNHCDLRSVNTDTSAIRCGVNAYGVCPPQSSCLGKPFFCISSYRTGGAVKLGGDKSGRKGKRSSACHVGVSQRL